MSSHPYYVINGKKDGRRIETRVLEEMIQKAISDGYRAIQINAYGQHGIGGRLWNTNHEAVTIRIEGNPGQRTGSMGFPNTFIEVNGPVSDDVGWLNAGATIVVKGNAGNGAANAMAQGKIYIAGNIGARGMTMTKHNPRFEPPELWVLGSVGDYFGEFMAGGIAVICGYQPQNSENILGYRPLVGMVGGQVFFRGPHQGYSQQDAKLVPIDDSAWEWLTSNLKLFLQLIDKPELFDKLTQRHEWQLLKARSPHEKAIGYQRSMAEFRRDVWDAELGKGGLVGDLITEPMSQIPVITTGNLRRFIPVWENKKYKAPCEASCPTGVPVHERWQLIRSGRIDEAVNMALTYTPFPATVCGYLCPNLCMNACTRLSASMPSVDITQLGKSSIKAEVPKLPPLTGKKIAVIGGGPAGISVAWQLRQHGHEAVIYDMSPKLGGKLSSVIPDSRIPDNVLEAELERIQKVIPHVHLQQQMVSTDIEQLKHDYEYIVIAIGAHQPLIPNWPGKERLITHLEFLSKAKQGSISPGKRVVIIGAGNVGCDVATEAHRLGAENITLIDIQEPLSFGKERKAAEAIGAIFRYPCFTKEITKDGVLLETGELIPADMVIISIGDRPKIDFLPKTVRTERGYIVVDENFMTSDPQIFAIGDAVKQGLLTDAIGSGRKAATAIIALLEGSKPPITDTRKMIDKKRVKLEYFNPRISGFDDIFECGSQCSSCGTCRDCGICVSICPQGAIERIEKSEGTYEYIAHDDRCIGCGFCSGACPCGVWNLVENTPLG